MALTVCVLAGASQHADPSFCELGREAGRALALRRWNVVYGGGRFGVMAAVAHAVIEQGGSLVGVIPDWLDEQTGHFANVTDLVRTSTIRERKHEMDSRSDAFLVLPGGIGTLEEFVEILTLRQLKHHNRPIVLIDPWDFWRELRLCFDRMIRSGLVEEPIDQLFFVAQGVHDALDHIQRSTSPET